MMPNVAGVRDDSWEKYKTSVRKIEGSTGYNFLNALPANIQEALETK
jgi:DNA/RNA endonuclease G (NUC1)